MVYLQTASKLYAGIEGGMSAKPTVLLEDLLFYKGQSSAITLAPCETIPFISQIFLHVYVIQLR